MFSQMTFSGHQNFGRSFRLFVHLLAGALWIAGWQAAKGQDDAPDKPAQVEAEGESQAQPKAEPQARIWRDDTGRFQVEATFVKLDAANIWLRLKDGQEVKVPLDRLNEEDKQFALNLAKPNPFEAVTKEETATEPPAAPVSTQTVKAGLVMVYAKTSRGTLPTPGVVIAAEGGRAVVSLHQRGEFSINGVGGIGLPPGRNAAAKATEALASWDADGERRTAALQPLSSVDGAPQYFSGDAGKLPEALAYSKTEPKAGDVLRLIGFDVSGQSFATTAQEATVERVFRGPAGELSEIRLNARTPRGTQMVVVVDREGAVLGVVEKDDGQMAFCRRPDLAALVRQANFDGRLAPVLGDRKTIEWKLTAVANDPFSRVKQARIRVSASPLQNRSPAARSPATGLPAAEERNSASSEPREFELTPVAESAGQWTAQVTLPNLGVSGYRFQLQFGYRDSADADWTWQPEQEQIFNSSIRNPRVFGATSIGGASAADPVSSIPGLNGRPLDMPLFANVDGGIQVTDEVTVWDGKNAEAAKDPPVPKKSEQVARIEWTKSNGYDWGKLAVGSPLNGHDRGRAPVAFSPDGKWLYVVDATNVLYQLDSASLEPQRQLQLGAECRALAVSKSRLIVPQVATSIVWILDPDELTVDKVWSLPGLQLVAAGAETDLGAVVRRPDTGSAIVRYGAGELDLVDWERGVGLHALKTRYGTQTSPVADKLGGIHIQITRRGDYLFTGYQGINRFHWTGEQLVYEQSSASLNSGHTTHFVVSDDAEFAAMPTGGGNGSGYGIRVLEARNLRETAVDIKNGAYPCAIGFDLKDKRIYTPNHQSLQVFSEEGGLLASLKVSNHDICRVLIHPAGGQGLFWDSRSGSMWYFRREEAK